MAYLRTEPARDIVCIAGGSGLAPVLSIARGVAANPAMDGVRLHLFYGGRGARDICGEEMLRALPGFGERFFYHPIISMPDEAELATWSGKVGFVHELARDTIGVDLPAHEIYFAGPPAMAQAVQRMLFDAGVPGAQVHFDAFY
jgi:toluene monooxygenase electron transfer component